VRRLGVDAAILYADILLPLVPMGLDLSFAAGEGPVIASPVRTPEAVDRLHEVNVGESLGAVLEAVRLVRRELSGEVALIGFAGAPFTVASYAIEGGSTRQFVETKRFMYSAGAAWHRLMDRLVRVTSAYLAAQIEAGAQVVQVFDSWAGTLGADDYRRFVLPHQSALFAALRPLGVPSIHFGVGAGHLLELLSEAGGDVIGLDWRTPLDSGWDRVGAGRGVQGNLDPAALFAPRGELDRQVRRVLGEASGRAGHVFNLGHGILPGTPVDAVRRVVDLVHENSSTGAAPP
jgi:uroporphyrinogen decarboxylase